MVGRRLLAIDREGGGADVRGIAVGTVAAVLLCIAATASYIWNRWRRDKCVNIPLSFHVGEDAQVSSRGREKTPSEGSSMPRSPPAEEPVEPTCLTFNDIQVATEGFKQELLFWETAFSIVYRAEGPQGEPWAVKRAKGLSAHGQRLFHSEVDFLAKVYHECLLPLRGYCSDEGQQILVFDFMPNGTLTSWLRPSTDFERSRPPLTFTQRLAIAGGVADALKYLHAFRKPTIIHRDIRSDNILLTEDLQPKLGGLGLLKHLPGDQLRERVAGRKGYLDPEYFQTYKVTAKCDVYSFGVVLLELLTGCAPFVQVSRSSEYKPTPLPVWATEAVEEGRTRDILDPRLTETGEECPSTVEAFATLACACVAHARRDRPDMARVAAILAALQKMPGDASLDVTILASQTGAGGRVVPLA